MEVPLQDIVYGSSSKLVAKLNFKAEETTGDDYYWKTGDAILYNPAVTPLLEKSTNSASNPHITVDSGTADSKLAGKVLAMSSYNYPNRLFKVLTGLPYPNYSYLPFRCSDVNFDSMDVYSWMQNEPAKNTTDTPITTINMNTMAVQK